MSFKMTYKLIQQTPLIHFQHGQHGATLRATEVKPKLDKFIIKKLGGKDNVPKEWFIAETNALNYKMRIVATGTPVKSNTIDLTLELKKTYDNNQKRNLNNQIKSQINSMYFGNMVSEGADNYEETVRNNYKETVFYGKDTYTTLEVNCFVDSLKNAIDDYIEEFFFVNNFGTRQSKGFGGFVVVKNGDEHKVTDPVKTLSEQGYRFFYAEVKGDTSYSTMLNHAKNVYAVMKGGYNHTRWDEYNKKYKFPHRYIKGYIQRDFLDDFNWWDKGSDKAFIKSKKNVVIDKITKQPYQYPEKRYGQPGENRYNKFAKDEENYVFVRALFGLADYYEFRDEVRKGRVEIFSLGKNSFDVERFRSPVTIKIIDNKLIFLFGSFKNICGKTFYFAPNGIPDKKGFDKRSETEKVRIIQNNPDVFMKIYTPEKFDDNDIIKFINLFTEYFFDNSADLNNFKNKNKNGTYTDTDISISSNLTLIVPKHIERRI